MSFIQIKDIEINIGLKNEYKLIQFSDVHAVTYSDNDKLEEITEAKKAEDLWYRQRTWFADKANESYTDEQMIDSKYCLKKLIDYSNSELPDAVILNGDIIDYYSISNYKLLYSEINRIKYPYVFCNGNHEIDIIKYKDITKNIYGFSVVNLKEFKIVSLDNSKKMISQETLDLFKKELNDNMPIIVTMHIPISTEYNKEYLKGYDPYFLIDESSADGTTKEFIDILKNNKNIKAILAGHTHRFGLNEFTPNKKQVISSSGLIGMVNKIIIK